MVLYMLGYSLLDYALQRPGTVIEQQFTSWLHSSFYGLEFASRWLCEPIKLVDSGDFARV